MVFSSVVFLFLFLPFSLGLYFLLPKNKILLQNTVLLLLSAFFYYWGDQGLILVMALCILLNYGAGRLLELPAVAPRDGRRRLVFTAAVAGSLALLFYYKYAVFLKSSWNGLLAVLGAPAQLQAPALGEIALPLGISFYTFHALSYTFDVYARRLPAETSLIRFAGYVTLFPQLVAGPIVRYRDIYPQFFRRCVTRAGLTHGIRRFMQGLAKKVLLANTLAKTADGIFALPPEQLTAPVAWLGAVAYALQIYYDFSGYSDMAIGLGRMLGFHYKENFLYPYQSRSIQEFWQRWHISLSSWLRDYVYISLGGSRAGAVRTGLNLLLVFLLCGLWHGASWNFVLWGGWFGLLLIMERVLGLRAYLEKSWTWLGVSYVWLLVLVGWVVFRAETLPQALQYYQALFGLGLDVASVRTVAEFLPGDVVVALAAALLLCKDWRSLLRSWLLSRRGRENKQVLLLWRAATLSFAMGAFILSLMSLANGYYNPFIYFRF